MTLKAWLVSDLGWRLPAFDFIREQKQKCFYLVTEIWNSGLFCGIFRIFGLKLPLKQINKYVIHIYTALQTS